LRKQGSTSITWGVTMGEDDCDGLLADGADRFTVGQQVV
jgi:hypothetical protein